MSTSRKRGSIRERGPKQYEVRIFLGYETDPKTGQRSRRNHTKTFATLKEAKRYLSKKVTEKDDGTFIEPSRETLSKYLTRWLEGKKIRERTRSDYKGVIERYIIPALGNRKLSELNAVEIELLYNNMGAPKEAGGMGLSAGTIHHVHTVLNSALKKAVKQRLIAHNPAEATERPTVERLSVEQQGFTSLTPEQAITFLQAAKSFPGDPDVIEAQGADPRTGEDDRYYALFVVLLMTGARPGEALALQWSDLELEKGLLHVRRTLVNRSGVGKHFALPKTKKSARTLDLPEIAVQALKEHRRKQLEERLAAGPAWEDGDLVFPTVIGTPSEHQNIVNRHFKPLLKAAGLPDVRLYDLRHSYTSLRHALGHSLLQISRGLGHSTIKLTADTYAHLFREQEKEAAADLDRLLSQASG